MNIEITKIENPVLVDNEIELCSQLCSFVKLDNLDALKKLLKNHEKDKKSGIYSDIESNVSSFYELNQTLTSSWVLRPKFRNLERSQIKDLLIQRIQSLKEGVIELPEGLYQLETIRINYEGRLVDVEEVMRETWDFILFTSKFYKNEYYVNMVFEKSFASWNKDLKLTEGESKIVETGNREDIIRMIHLKRQENC